MIDVAGDDDRAVLGTVPAVEEDLAVGVLVGHVLDVGEEADRRVLVGVRRVRRVLHRLVQKLRNGDDALLLYSPSTARASFWKAGSSYFRLRNRSASISTAFASAEAGMVMW